MCLTNQQKEKRTERSKEATQREGERRDYPSDLYSDVAPMQSVRAAAERGVDGGGGLFEVRGVVRFEEEFSVGGERLVNGAEDFRLDEAFPCVAFLGPWVREEEVEPGGAAGWQEPAEGVAAFEAEDADIGDAESVCAAADFGDATAESFDAEEIAFREACRHFEEEGAVAAADIDFEGAGGVREDGLAGQSGEVVAGDQFVWAGHARFLGSGREGA